MPKKQNEGRNKEYICHHPGKWIAKADTKEMEGWYQPDAYATSCYHLHHTAQHTQVAVTKSLNAIAEDGEQS